MINEIKLLKEIKNFFKMRIGKTNEYVDRILDYNKQICNIIDKQAKVTQ
jgi:hypothetical protein